MGSFFLKSPGLGYFCKNYTNLMKLKMKKLLALLGVITAIFVLFLTAIPYLFPEKLKSSALEIANTHLESELHFEAMDISVFRHFPYLTVSLSNIDLKGSEPYATQSLVSATEVDLGVNLAALLFRGEVSVNRIFINNPKINVQVSEEGIANYNVYIANPEQVNESESNDTRIQLEHIEITNADVIYNDRATKVYLDAIGFNYLGKGDLSEAVFDLKTKATIEKLNLDFDGETYLSNKEVNARLITNVNTNSLSILFEKNSVKINKLPVNFKGKLDFLNNGYNIDFELLSKRSKLEDFFTALPPAYVTWLDKTSVKGTIDLALSLKGAFIASENIKPEVKFDLGIQNGFVNYNKAPLSIESLSMDFKTVLPSLDMDQLKIDLKEFKFKLGKDFVDAKLQTIGFDRMKVDALIKAQLDLSQLKESAGLPLEELKGKFFTDINVEGVYDYANGSFPKVKGDIKLNNGLIQTEHYPNPINNISVNAVLDNPSNALETASMVVSNSGFDFEGNRFNVDLKVLNFADVNYEAAVKGILDIGKIYQVFKQDGVNVNGQIKTDISFKGVVSDVLASRYHLLENKGTLQVSNLTLQSEYFPLPWNIKSGDFTFYNDKMQFHDFQVLTGRSDIAMTGSLNNVYQYVMDDSAVLKGSFDFRSSKFYVDDFYKTSSSNGEENKENANSIEENFQEGVLQIPKNYNLNLLASIGELIYDDLSIQAMRGHLHVDEGVLRMKNAKLETIGTRVEMNGEYHPINKDKATFSYQIKAEDFDIQRAYKEIRMFRELASAAENAEGIVSLDYALKGVLDADMMPVMPSLEGGGILSVKNVKMVGFKMFNVVSEKTETDVLKNADISKVNIKTTIKNNIMKMERVRFKIAGFRPRIEGETSLDGKLNFKMRLGLPPLGLIGIPISITGTQENPQVKLGNKTQDLEEAMYDEGDDSAAIEVEDNQQSQEVEVINEEIPNQNNVQE